jgi:glucose/mannose transport system permease protein
VRGAPGMRPTPERMPSRRHPDLWLSRAVLSPTVALAAVFLYGFALWTGWISLTASTMLPHNDFAGLLQYRRLFANPRWLTAYGNLFVFGVLFVVACVVLGLLLAILLDRRIRCEGMLRTIFLYPMAVSFIVTGTAWRWLLDPSLGLPQAIRALGWPGFAFDWLADPDRALYTLVIAGAWQSSGFAMALFLAGLRGIDEEIVKAARIDGAPVWKIYALVLVPMLRPVLLTVVVLLSLTVIRAFDLVVALTGGGPGYASDLPARFMYETAFRRDQLGLGAASAMVMLFTFVAVLAPYLYAERRGS